MLTSRSGLAVHDVPHVCGEYELGLVRLLALKRLEQNLNDAKKSALRGEVGRQASPMSRRGCGSTKRRSFTRSSRTSTSTATSGSNVTP